MIVHTLPPESYLRFQRHLTGIGAGVESTHIARVHHPLAGHITAFVKLYKAPSKPLFNEIAGYLLGHALGLPQPHLGFIALIPIIALEQPPAWLAEARKHQATWPAWCTQRVEAGITPGLIFNFREGACLAGFKKDLTGWPDLPRVLGFDEWIANIDRHFNNLLRLGKSRYAIIDHGRLLTAGGRWRVEDTDPLGWFRNRLIEHLWSGRPPLPVKSQMTLYAEAHTRAFAEAEEELVLWADILLSDDETASIITFIRERAKLGTDLIRKRYQLLI